LRLFSFGGYGLALAALALVVFGAIECPPKGIQPQNSPFPTFNPSFLQKKSKKKKNGSI